MGVFAPHAGRSSAAISRPMVGKDTRPPTGAIDTHKRLGAKHEHDPVPFGVEAPSTFAKLAHDTRVD